MGTNIEACRNLLAEAERSGLVVQVGNNRRFDPGMTFAHQFVREELGPGSRSRRGTTIRSIATR